VNDPQGEKRRGPQENTFHQRGSNIRPESVQVQEENREFFRIKKKKIWGEGGKGGWGDFLFSIKSSRDKENGQNGKLCEQREKRKM